VSNENAQTAFLEVEKILQGKDFALVAIDGRCAGGKTTLAQEIKELCGEKNITCEIVHMDHFYPQLAQRTEARLNEPGGNLDRERFLEEVMEKATARQAFSYTPYDPINHQMEAPIEISSAQVMIFEGSYSCHPLFSDNYDMKIFMDVSMPTRLRRIKLRNGDDGLDMFIEKWIPKEEMYFLVYGIQERADLEFNTG